MVNVQTEHLENHTAKLTVDIEPERVEKAMRQTARKISKKARIPGFRPGKAPFNVVVNMFGYDYVLNEALQVIVDDVYKEALDASEVEPYAPGSLEDIAEQGKQLVFNVPKRPEIDLGDYRDLRIDFEEPEVTDEMVNDAMEELREGQAVIEDVERPAKLDDQVEIGHLYVGLLLNEEEIAELEAAEAEAGDDDATDTSDDDSDSEDVTEAADDDDDDDADATASVDEPERGIFHQHDITRVLFEDEDKDLLPGFSAEIVDAQAGDDIEFYLDIPEDFEDEQIAGRRVRVEAGVKTVQSRTVPEWSDDLAVKISDEQFATMLELRMDVRKQLEESAQNTAQRELADQALEQITEAASLSYPPDVVADYVDDMVRELEQNVLSQQGLKLEHYLTMTQQSEEEFRVTLEPRAAERAERALVLGEIVKLEELETIDADIDAEIEAMVAQMGGEESAGQFRSFFNSDASRWNLGQQIASRRATERLVAIVKGEEPPTGVERDDATEADVADDDTVADETPADDNETATETADETGDAATDTDATPESETDVQE